MCEKGESTKETFQFCYKVPEAAGKDMQMMAVWAQCLEENMNQMSPDHLRAAWEWFKSYGESKITKIENGKSD